MIPPVEAPGSESDHRSSTLLPAKARLQIGFIFVSYLAPSRDPERRHCGPSDWPPGSAMEDTEQDNETVVQSRRAMTTRTSKRSSEGRLPGID
jgi:hypothetical protein